jgi:uncharacterized protein (UPF0276 family)
MAPARVLPAVAGIGLRAPHVAEVRDSRPPIGWLEVHSENYFVDGGPALAALEAIRAGYPVSLHGVGLSLGSADPLDVEHLARLKRLASRIEPSAVSEHLCWSHVDGRHLNDLLPLPLTGESLALVCDRIDAVQFALGRALLVENVSSYLRFASDTIAEWDFVAAASRAKRLQAAARRQQRLCHRSQSRLDPHAYLAAIPAGAWPRSTSPATMPAGRA